MMQDTGAEHVKTILLFHFVFNILIIIVVFHTDPVFCSGTDVCCLFVGNSAHYAIIQCIIFTLSPSGSSKVCSLLPLWHLHNSKQPGLLCLKYICIRNAANLPTLIFNPVTVYFSSRSFSCTDEGVGCRLPHHSLGHLLPPVGDIMYVSVSMTRADTCPVRPSLSPNGSVGVETITSSTQNGAVDFINQSSIRTKGVLKHEHESCAAPDWEPQIINTVSYTSAEMQRCSSQVAPLRSEGPSSSTLPYV